MTYIYSVKKKYEIVSLGRQLWIIDVQKIFPSSEKLVDKIVDYAKGFDEIIYLYDIMSSDDHETPHDMYRKIKDTGHLRARMKIAEKEFGFFRNAMDSIRKRQRPFH